MRRLPVTTARSYAAPPDASLAGLLERGRYVGYSYAYPHKTTYAPLTPPRPLSEVWAHEDRSALFLYVHVPFCEMRCGFCNLFTELRPAGERAERYVDALERQAHIALDALGPGTSFARFALGGGTPTQLSTPLLARVLDVGARLAGGAPAAVECSPETATAAQLALLSERRVSRLSVGVQSFFDAELSALGRPSRGDGARRALERIAASGIARFNVDLIYGIHGQSVESWLESVREALRYAPTELFLYPLYVRPKTGLDGRPLADVDLRPQMWRAARELLESEGYAARSMRLFERTDAPRLEGPRYSCQSDGMLGLGPGARSYTRALHYSDEWAVGRRGVREIVDGWLARTDSERALAHYGCTLDDDERRRRHVIQSLLQAEGLSRGDYRARFSTDALDDLPQLAELAPHGLATLDEATLRLTADGLGASDVIGPWLYSARSRERSEAFVVR